MGVEDQVLDLISTQNKPFSVQLAADFLAQFGIKKSQAQKALEHLAEEQKIRFKDFGKTRIYLPKQDGKPLLSREEIEAKRALVGTLKEDCASKQRELAKLESEVKVLQSTLSLEELMTQTDTTKEKVEDLEKEALYLKQTAVMVTDEEKHRVQEALERLLKHWKERKRIFKNIWSTIEESFDRKTSELFEEIGVDTDSACDVSPEEAARTIVKRRKLN